MTNMALPCSVGSILSELDKPARVCTIIQARVLIFDIEFPITQGYPVSFPYTCAVNCRSSIHYIHWMSGVIFKPVPSAHKISFVQEVDVCVL